MSDWIQWIITTIVGIVGVFIGRYWQKLDYSRDKDKDTLARLDKYLPFETVKYIREHDFGGSFPNTIFDELRRFHEESKNPDFIFLNRELEKNRKKLVDLTQEFQNLIALNSFPVENPNLDYNKIPQSHEFPSDDKWLELMKKIHSLADDIFKTYSNIKQTARKKI